MGRTAAVTAVSSSGTNKKDIMWAEPRAHSPHSLYMHRALCLSELTRENVHLARDLVLEAILHMRGSCEAHTHIPAQKRASAAEGSKRRRGAAVKSGGTLGPRSAARRSRNSGNPGDSSLFAR